MTHQMERVKQVKSKIVVSRSERGLPERKRRGHVHGKRVLERFANQRGLLHVQLQQVMVHGSFRRHGVSRPPQPGQGLGHLKQTTHSTPQPGEGLGHLKQTTHSTTQLSHSLPCQNKTPPPYATSPNPISREFTRTT
jgi:hypothetical protein